MKILTQGMLIHIFINQSLLLLACPDLSFLKELEGRLGFFFENVLTSVIIHISSLVLLKSRLLKLSKHLYFLAGWFGHVFVNIFCQWFGQPNSLYFHALFSKEILILLLGNI